MTTARRLYAEELPVGERLELGSYTLSHDEIVSFARDWDPQPFHIDEAAARDGFFGEVIASGVQTQAVFQRLFVQGALKDWEVIAGRRVRNVELTLAVRAGMRLDASVEVMRVTPVDDVRSLMTKRGMLDHDGRAVMRIESEAYVRRRPPAQS